jgi:hypothetical protein
MAELDDLRAAAKAKLDQQAARARDYQAYYDNEAGIIAILDTEERRTFRTLLDEAGASWCELVVNAVAERMTVTGFRFGSDADDELAWAIWQANSMDADHELVHTDALVTGSSFVLVAPDDDNPTGVSVTVESPQEACVLYRPGNRRKRIAGFKRWTEDNGQTTTDVLILPDQIVTWYPNARGPEIERNAGDTMIEIVPQPRTRQWPRSELAPAIPFQDRICTTIFNRLVATDYGAFRQIWATGIKIAREVVKTKAEDGTEGQAVRVQRPFDIGANRLLTNESPDGRFGSIEESSLAGYLSSVEQDVEHLAAVTQTPPTYLLGRMVNLSAEAITAAEAGLVAKVRRRSLHVGEGWEEVERTALGLVGSPAAANFGAEVIWADFETRSLAQLTDSLVKMRTLGVPLEALWERYGATQEEIDRWREMSAAQPAPEPEGVPVP